MKLNRIEEIIEDVRSGRMIVIVDDNDRENEGDLMVAAEKVTADAIGFMIEHGKGLICLCLTAERVRELNLNPQVSENTAPLGTNFTVSIDHVSSRGAGVSAAARAKTIREAASPDAHAQDFSRPGWVFPLAAMPGGVLHRRGQTEGSVDLARLAGLSPAGVICETMGADGKMLRGKELQDYCRQHDLKITSVQDLVEYRLRNEVSVRRTGESQLSTMGRFPQWSEDLLKRKGVRAVSYLDDVSSEEHLAFVVGDPGDGALVRIHSECLTGDVFGSSRCDCGDQFNHAFESIVAAGSGVLVYLFQEGRGIGLGNKLRAYQLQDQGLDTVEANLKLGFAPDLRNYRVGAQIIKDLGLTRVRLMTNNPAKVEALEDFGIAVVDRVPVVAKPQLDNLIYLRTKRDRLGHYFPDLK